LRVRDGADCAISVGGYGCIIVVGVYVQKGVPEGTFVGLIAEDAEGKDVVLDARRWVHGMGAGGRIYYRLKVPSIAELGEQYLGFILVFHISLLHDR